MASTKVTDARLLTGGNASAGCLTACMRRRPLVQCGHVWKRRTFSLAVLCFRPFLLHCESGKETRRNGVVHSYTLFLEMSVRPLRLVVEQWIAVRQEKQGGCVGIPHGK